MKSPAQNFKEGMDKGRIERYAAGMMTPWEIVEFYQDVIEAQVMYKLPQDLFVFIHHYVFELHLCYVTGARLH